MTRETKVGLVVAASFLSLVGLVAVCKFREGVLVPPDAGDLAALAGHAAGAVEPEKEKPPTQTNDPQQNDPKVVQAVAVNNDPPPALTPPAPMNNDPPDPPPVVVVNNDPPAPAPAPAPINNDPPMTASPVLAPVAPMTSDPPSPAPVLVPTPSPVPEVGDDMTEKEPKPMPNNGSSEIEKSPLLPPAPPAAIIIKDTTPPSPAPVDPPAPPAPMPPFTDKEKEKKDGPPLILDPVPAPAPMSPPSPVAPPVSSPGLEISPPAPVKVEDPSPKLGSETSPRVVPMPGEATNPNQPPDPGPGVIISPPMSTGSPTRNAPTGVAPSPSPPPIPPIPPTADDAPPSPGIKPMPKPMPPIGASATAQTPPIKIGGQGTQPKPPMTTPQVDSFDEEDYKCKPGDTLQSISARFFGTEKYAQALLMFNRAHPMCSEGILRNPPVLEVGAMVHIPPAPVLEKRYGSLIPDLKPLATQTKSNVPDSSPAPPVKVDKAKTQPVNAGWKKYRVVGNGEWMLDIARRTLNDGERWRDIYRLNPSFRPEAIVPANAVLNLPPDAKVDGPHTP